MPTARLSDSTTYIVETFGHIWEAVSCTVMYNLNTFECVRQGLGTGTCRGEHSSILYKESRALYGRRDWDLVWRGQTHTHTP